MLLEMLGHSRVDPTARTGALAEVLAESGSNRPRQRARRSLRTGAGRLDKLQRVADTFAWGVRMGRQLTGKLFTLEMIAGEELGYTRLNENKLYITPLPLLRSEESGREVVRALILHEYGHHLYHKGTEAEEVWQRAEEEKLQRLLNLVSDEHLERNLRSRDAGFGNELKQLAAYAFQHNARELAVETLLSALRGQAFSVLSRTRLAVARKPACVKVDSGWVMRQMEEIGMSFARFLRCLRMGRENLHQDEKVSEALKLFPKKTFAHSMMPEMMEITRKLRQIFGEAWPTSPRASPTRSCRRPSGGRWRANRASSGRPASRTCRRAATTRGLKSRST
jgi:hypothetical protein